MVRTLSVPTVIKHPNVSRSSFPIAIKLASHAHKYRPAKLEVVDSCEPGYLSATLPVKSALLATALPRATIAPLGELTRDLGGVRQKSRRLAYRVAVQVVHAVLALVTCSFDNPGFRSKALHNL